MSASNLDPPPRLPRRDFVILPLLSLVTLALLGITSELAARFFFPEMEKDDACRIADPVLGFKFRPNCISRVKSAEGPWVVNQYNECGFRTYESCGPKPPGTTRIALIGSSVALGLYVSYDEAWAPLTAKELTRACGHPVEIQNLGREMCMPDCEYYRIDEALALKPDLAIMTVATYDLEQIVLPDFTRSNTALPPKPASPEPAKYTGLLKHTQNLLTSSRAMTVAEHYLFQDPATYSRLYLAYGDKADFLRRPLTPAWEARLRDYDLLLAHSAAKFRDAHVPLVLIEIPTLAQVSVLVAPNTPSNVDPFALDHRLEQIASKHDVLFISVLSAFQHTAGSNRYFYMVDGHMKSEGEALVARSFVDQLLANHPELFAECTLPSREQVVRKNL